MMYVKTMTNSQLVETLFTSGEQDCLEQVQSGSWEERNKVQKLEKVVL
jgi:hypothetical protein